MSDVANIPVVRCRLTQSGQLAFWCPFCKREHLHGAPAGHRRAHCHTESPFRSTGYELTLQADPIQASDRPPLPENVFPTIGANWSHFLRVDVSPNAPEIQRLEMSRAFYAGVSTGLAQACFAQDSGDFPGKLNELLAEIRTWKALSDATYRSRR